MITVTCRKRDPHCFVIPKYSHFGPGRKKCDHLEIIPLDEGVYNRRHLRKTDPKKDILSPIARFLVDNLDGTEHVSIHGANSVEKRIVVYSGYKEADLLRKKAAEGKLESFNEDPKEKAEKIIAGMGLDECPIVIQNYVLPVIEPNETDEQYWERVAEELIVGNKAVRIEIRQFKSYPTEEEIVELKI